MRRVLRQAVGDKASCAQNTLSFLPVKEKYLAVRLRWPFPPACRGKGCLMDLVCACDGLFPLPVEECALAMGFPPCLSRKKGISWTRCALAMAFIPCLSRKNPFQGTPASPREAPKGPQKWPGSSRAKKLQLLF